MKHLALFFVTLVSFASLASANKYELQQKDFLKKNLPLLLEQYADADNKTLVLNSSSIRLSEPALFKAINSKLDPWMLPEHLMAGQAHCSKATFTVEYEDGLYEADTYLIVNESAEENHLSYQANYGSIQILMTNGCWGMNKFNDPVLNFRKID